MNLKDQAKLNRDIVTKASDELGIPEEKIPVLVEKMLKNDKSREMLFKALGEFVGRRAFLGSMAGFGAAALGMGIAGAKTVITDQNVIVDDEWYLKAPAPFSALVGIDGTKVIAYDWKGKEIASGVAGMDDASVIQSAVDSLTVGRTWKEKVIIIGNYIANEKITIPSNTIVEIMGYIKLGDNTNDQLLEIIGAENIEIKGGVLDGNKANNTLGNCIYLTGSKNIKIIDIEVKNAYYNGIYVDGTGIGNNTNIVLENIIAHDNGAVSLGQNVLCNNSEIKIIGGEFYKGFDHGLYLSNGTTGSVIGAKAYNNGSNGIQYRGDHISIKSCEVFGNSNYGIRILGSNAKVIGNEVHDNSANIQVYDDGANPDNIEIIGNICYNSPELQGIQILAGTGIIKGNTCYNNGRQGINISGVTNWTVIGNKCFNNGQFSNYGGIVLTNATYITVFGNVCYDDQATRTQIYGIQEAGTSDYNIIEANRVDAPYVFTGAHTYCDERLYTSLPTDGFAVTHKPVHYYDSTVPAYYLAVWDGSAWRKVQVA